MSTAERLPPELWLMIFELTRGTNTSTLHYCNYLTFPHLNLHLRRPSEHPFTVEQWPRNFRLVCRYFNSLLKSPPFFFMKDSEAMVPTAARAVYLLPEQKALECLKRLLADPSFCSRITLLNLPWHGSHTWSPPPDFDFLCDNANVLPALRTLAICFRVPGKASPVVPRVWGRLNKAFPLLTTLVVRGGLVTTYPDPEVAFKNLEVMDWDEADHHPSLQFPAVRHASFGSASYFELKYFNKWPHLESLIFRSLSTGVQFEWSLFPELKLLGLPAQRIDAFPPIPPDHPLQHLYVFIGTRPRDDHNQHLFAYEVGFNWLKETLERMPTITRLTLWFDKRGYNRLNWISGYFREEDLELLGWTQRDFPSRSQENGYHYVYQRVEVEPQHLSESITGEEMAPKHSSFRVGWNKFVQSTSRRLHLQPRPQHKQETA